MRKDKKPKKEDFGWINQESYDSEPSGWAYEEGEEAYYKALAEWENLQIILKNRNNGTDKA